MDPSTEEQLVIGVLVEAYGIDEARRISGTYCMARALVRSAARLAAIANEAESAPEAGEANSA